MKSLYDPGCYCPSISGRMSSITSLEGHLIEGEMGEIFMYEWFNVMYLRGNFMFVQKALFILFFETLLFFFSFRKFNCKILSNFEKKSLKNNLDFVWDNIKCILKWKFNFACRNLSSHIYCHAYFLLSILCNIWFILKEWQPLIITWTWNWCLTHKLLYFYT